MLVVAALMVREAEGTGLPMSAKHDSGIYCFTKL